MSGSERMVRTGMLAGGAALDVGATKVAAKVVEKAATKAKAASRVRLHGSGPARGVLGTDRQDRRRAETCGSKRDGVSASPAACETAYDRAAVTMGPRKRT